jgi:hypothetical protein
MKVVQMVRKVMNKKTMNSFILLITLLTMSRLESMQCHKQNIFTLLRISPVKPPRAEVREISHSQLNPLDLTFNSQHYFIAGTKVDSCNLNYKIRIDEVQHRTIKRFSRQDKYIYILAQKTHENEASHWFQIKSTGVTMGHKL